MDIRDEPPKQDAGDGGHVRGISTGVLFAGIAATIILVVILGCIGNRKCRKGKLEKQHVEYGS